MPCSAIVTATLDSASIPSSTLLSFTPAHWCALGPLGPHPLMALAVVLAFQLLLAGVPAKTIEAWTIDPQVQG